MNDARVLRPLSRALIAFSHARHESRGKVTRPGSVRPLLSYIYARHRARGRPTPHPMKKLLLVRHAKSAWDNLDGSDHNRPLNSRGAHDAPAMGAHLLARGIRPDLILASSAVRTTSTAQALADAMSVDAARIQILPSLYLAHAADILAAVAACPDTVDTIMLVAHSPGIGDASGVLTGEPPRHMPTCAVACLGSTAATWREAAQPGGCTLQFWTSPRQLRHGMD